MEALYAGPNERVEAETANIFLQYIYPVPATKNHQNIRSRCLVHEFSVTDTF